MRSGRTDVRVSRGTTPAFCLLLLFPLLSGDGPGSIAAEAASPAPDHRPVEAGRVEWGRDVDAALQASEESGKPVFLLFQEVPGCATCKRFGKEPLSHPLLVEAIEDLFVPVLIYNNREGEDAEVLQRFEERAWNNPVVRFLDSSGRDLVARRERVWATGAVATRSIHALKAAGRPVPKYLEAVVGECAPRNLRTATFGMACFWVGEERLGAVAGVIRSRCVWVGGREGVEVVYDPSVVDYRTLVGTAATMGCAGEVFCHSAGQLAAAKHLVRSGAEMLGEPARPSKASDQKKRMQGNVLNLLPLTPMQATKINAFRRGCRHREWLSPRQIELAKRLTEAYRADPAVIKGLTRPEETEQLPAYDAEIRARLQRAGVTQRPSGRSEAARP